MDSDKVTAIIIIVLMSFFINIFYYVSWMVMDWWLTGKDSLVDGMKANKL